MHSNLAKLIRITILILRFIRSCARNASISSKLSPVLRNFPLPTVERTRGEEVLRAKVFWSWIVSRAAFGKEMESLQKHDNLQKSYPLLGLNPVLKDGLLRVGGRLRRRCTYGGWKISHHFTGGISLHDVDCPVLSPYYLTRR